MKFENILLRSLIECLRNKVDKCVELLLILIIYKLWNIIVNE